MKNLIETVDTTNHVAKPDFLAKTRVVKSTRSLKISHFLMVFGPGLIVMEADNDAGAKTQPDKVK